MVRSEYFTKASAICLLFFSLTVSGNGALAEVILHQIAHNREVAADERFSNSKCSSLKGDDFRDCRSGCMSALSFQRSIAKSEAKAREKAQQLKKTEEEPGQFDKSLTDKILKGRSEYDGGLIRLEGCHKPILFRMPKQIICNSL